MLIRLLKKINRWQKLARSKWWQDRKARKTRRAWEKRFLTDTPIRFVTKGVQINLYKDSVLSELIYKGFEEDEINFFESYLKEGDILFDIGANIGLFTLLGAKTVSNTGAVYSFEPTPKVYNRLVDNIAINQFQNAFPFQLGLSNKSDTLAFNVSANGYDAWNSFANKDKQKLQTSIAVAVTTIDDFIVKEAINKSKIALVKIDVEGWEKFVLEGGRKFLQEYSPALMVEFTEVHTMAAGYGTVEIYKLLQNWGYNWYKWVRGALVPEERRENYPYDNLIALKPDNRLLIHK